MLVLRLLKLLLSRQCILRNWYSYLAVKRVGPQNQKSRLLLQQESSDDEQEDDKVLETSPNGNYYKVNKEIGRGSFKAVYRGMDANNGVSVAWCELLVSHHCLIVMRATDILLSSRWPYVYSNTDHR